jgi:hypothetical protein
LETKLLKRIDGELTSHGAQSNVLEGQGLEHEIAQGRKIGRKFQIAAFIIDHVPFCDQQKAYLEAL